MKTIGMIGGTTWESTVEYYRIINETVREKLGGTYSARCILHSLNFGELGDIMEKDGWPGIEKVMVDAAKKIKDAGADFIILCANTTHRFADIVEEKVGIPILHIVDVTAEEIHKKNIKKAGLLGTKFTMEEDFFKSRMKKKHGIEIIIPHEESRNRIHDMIFNELAKGIKSDDSRRELLNIIKDLIKNGAKGIILGCTEFFLLVDEKDIPVPTFETMRIHARAAALHAIK